MKQHLDARREEFYRFDIDNDGAITESDLKLQQQIREAGARASALFTPLSFDLDGDGVVTRSEVETSLSTGPLRMYLAPQNGELSEAQRKQIQEGVDTMMAPDANADGRIDSAELLAYAEKRAIRYNGNPLLGVVLAVDADKDGRVTLDEYLKAAEAAFQKADSNGDGVLSQGEIDAYRKQQMPQPGAVK